MRRRPAVPSLHPALHPGIPSEPERQARMRSHRAIFASVITLSTAAQYTKGVGDARARLLANKGIRTVEDLLYYLPFRYEDRTRVRGLGEVRPGEIATVMAPVLRARTLRLRRSPLKIFSAEVGQGPHRLHCKWFNSPYLEGIIQPGQLLALHGKVEVDLYEGGLQILQPQYEILPELPGGTGVAGYSLEVGRIVPIYETVGGRRLGSRFFRRVIHYALESLAGVEDPLPASVTAQLGLIPRWEALRNVHFPPPGTRLSDLEAFRSPAQVRLIFEEFFLLETGLALKRKRARQRPGIAFRADARIRESLKRVLPFHPTAAQKRALAEIVEDLRASRPMHRLLQGDVGSGKTIVALQAAVIAIENGYQVVLMAPTEVLATQHYLYFRRLLRDAGYPVVLLSSSATPKEKKAIKKLLAEGRARMAIGTHALVEEDVQFQSLGLVVIDEQHRFGVLQRLQLMQKGRTPDTLVMTATPIPRTLALTLYGDLDVSVLDELPAGRLPVLTRQIAEEAATEAYEFVRSQAASGAQAFIVCPLIEDSVPEDGARAGDWRSALKVHQFLSHDVFPEFQVGLLHGRMSSEEKEQTMQVFQSGEIRILVGTTVIEVGVDVPNATVMVIQQAERFGLAQLHQLRGRVGRGRKQSHCLLLTSRDQTETARQRLAALERTHDGFEIAELDLRLRGPGEFMGTRQTGLPALRIAELLRDQEILEWARRLAMDFVETGDGQELTRLASYIRENWNRRYGLVTVG